MKHIHTFESFLNVGSEMVEEYAFEFADNRDQERY